MAPERPRPNFCYWSSQKPSDVASARLKQDYLQLKRDPIPYITAEPLPQNILEWHYVIKGPEDSPFHGGYYHGSLIFTRDFPFRPPSFFMFTPNGRFWTNKPLCLSISDFHPESWNPAWSIATILMALLSFMLEKPRVHVGGFASTTKEKRSLAQKSLEFNLRDKLFVELFPDVVDEIKEQLASVSKSDKDGAGPSSKGEASGDEELGEGAMGTSNGVETELSESEYESSESESDEAKQ